jgi:cell pole-organizing protein PopZ
MNKHDTNPKEDMTMDDILSSIRKYIAEEDEDNAKKTSTQDSCEQDSIITLGKNDVVGIQEDADPESLPEAVNIYEEVPDRSINRLSEQLKRTGPFDKLTEALNSYGRHKDRNIDKRAGAMTVDQLITIIAKEVIDTWVRKNLRTVVEEIVMKEIEKIKAE